VGGEGEGRTLGSTAAAEERARNCRQPAETSLSLSVIHTAIGQIIQKIYNILKKKIARSLFEASRRPPEAQKIAVNVGNRNRGSVQAIYVSEAKCGMEDVLKIGWGGGPERGEGCASDSDIQNADTRAGYALQEGQYQFSSNGFLSASFGQIVFVAY
jgi:hypothetical protein